VATRRLSNEEKWIAFQRTVSEDEPHYGLDSEQLAIFMQSEDTHHMTSTRMPAGVFDYSAQATPMESKSVIAQLMGFGLLEVFATDRDDSRLIWKYTPQGIALSQLLQKEGNP
jgi:hypothetical protein